ncbi:hypothetical protein GW17_00035568, partial [Ensete ventricosum]
MARSMDGGIETVDRRRLVKPIRLLEKSTVPRSQLLLKSTCSVKANFTSIDCGASDSYKDENGIAWETDESYISNGENRVVQNPDSVPEPMRTLRAFSSRKKNCY